MKPPEKSKRTEFRAPQLVNTLRCCESGFLGKNKEALSPVPISCPTHLFTLLPKKLSVPLGECQDKKKQPGSGEEKIYYLL